MRGAAPIGTLVPNGRGNHMHITLTALFAIGCFLRDEAGGARMEAVLIAAIVIAMAGLALLMLRRLQLPDA